MQLNYGIVLTCGTDNTPPGDHQVVDITPEEMTTEGIISAIEASGLTAADLRTQILVVLGTGSPTAATDALLIYTALLGFSGRRLHVAFDGKVFDTVAFDEAVRGVEDAGPPPQTPLHIQVGPTPRPDLPVIAFQQLSSPRGASMVRFAKRARLVVPDEPLAAIRHLVAVAGLRARGRSERLPFLVNGDEAPPTVEDHSTPIGIDLEGVRRAGVALRKRSRGDDRGAKVERVALSPRQQRLVEAADIPIERTMAELGARFNDDAEAWHCPRPDRHTNGDQNPSMRVVNGRVRCGRCDKERVDSLRLVMDTKGITPDEAADWLLGPPANEDDPLAALFA